MLRKTYVHAIHTSLNLAFMIFYIVKMGFTARDIPIFLSFFLSFFFFLVQNVACVYSLEPQRRRGSNFFFSYEIF